MTTHTNTMVRQWVSEHYPSYSRIRVTRDGEVHGLAHHMWLYIGSVAELSKLAAEDLAKSETGSSCTEDQEPADPDAQAELHFQRAGEWLQLDLAKSYHKLGLLTLQTR